MSTWSLRTFSAFHRETFSARLLFKIKVGWGKLIASVQFCGTPGWASIEGRENTLFGRVGQAGYVCFFDLVENAMSRPAKVADARNKQPMNRVDLTQRREDAEMRKEKELANKLCDIAGFRKFRYSIPFVAKCSQF